MLSFDGGYCFTHERMATRVHRLDAIATVPHFSSFFPHGSKIKYNNITDDISVYMCIEQIAVKSQFNPFESPGQFMKEIANGCHMTSFSI